MAKTRMLKHDLRTSEKVASWPIEIRYFWVLLWGYVDDHGKGKDNPLLVKADTFPLDPDITGDVIDGWLWRIAEAGVIARYTVAGTDYLQVINWKEHQKPPHPTADVLPAANDPQGTARELHAPCMKDAGSAHEDFTPVLGLGLGLVQVGSGLESSPPAMDSMHFEPRASFDDFWEAWPRTEGKADAAKAWAKAIRKANPDAILRAALDYAIHPHRPAKQFVPHGSTWLNGERWNDGPPTAPESEGPKATAAQRNLETVAHFRNLEATHKALEA